MTEKKKTGAQTDAPAPRDWGPSGPNGEPPNVRLAHTAEGTQERAIHGELYPPLTYIATSEMRIELPTSDDGTADRALQAAGFFHAYPHRVVQFSPHYRLITKKGA